MLLCNKNAGNSQQNARRERLYIGKSALSAFFLLRIRQRDEYKEKIFTYLISNYVNAQNVFIFILKCIFVGCFIISSMCTLLS